MSAVLVITRVGPLCSIQDAGRFGLFRHGITASGPMDMAAYRQIGGSAAAIEFTTAGIELQVESGVATVGFGGGAFTVRHNGDVVDWPGRATLGAGDILSITPGPSGNYGYLRFGAELAIVPVLGSVATSTRVALGGLDGRVLRVGDRITLSDIAAPLAKPLEAPVGEGPIRFVWGIHADLFSSQLRSDFVSSPFVVSSRMDRMGVRLDDKAGVFAGGISLSLVSDAIVPGDIQILGDGTPTVLMRDHQPTGGYPRIGTVITADLDRFAQLRPGTAVAFTPVSVDHAHQLLRSRT